MGPIERGPRRGQPNPPSPEPTRSERASEAVRTTVARNQFMAGFLVGQVALAIALVFVRLLEGLA